MHNDVQPSSVVMMSILAIIVGVGLIYWIYRVNRSVERDKFHRRNAAGIEEFDTFEDANRAQWKSNAADVFTKAFGTLAVLLIIGGGIGVAIGMSLPRPRVSLQFAAIGGLSCDTLADAAVDQSRGRNSAEIRSVRNVTEVERSTDQLICRGTATWRDQATSPIFIRIINRNGSNSIAWNDRQVFE